MNNADVEKALQEFVRLTLSHHISAHWMVKSLREHIESLAEKAWRYDDLNK